VVLLVHFERGDSLAALDSILIMTYNSKFHCANDVDI
jgi:hypothetical protein